MGWFQWFTLVRQNFPNRLRLGDEADQPDVAATIQAHQRKLLSHPSQQLRPGDP